MDEKNIKKSVESIKMPEEMRARIIQNCRLESDKKEEDHNMKLQTIFFNKGVRAAAIAASLCLCLTAAASAAGRAGYLQNITNWFGAVTGAEYKQADGEITVSAAAAGGELNVSAVFVFPDKAPYREIRSLGIGDYQIIDLSGTVAAEGSATALSKLSGGQAQITVPLDGIDSGDYRLIITSFTGMSKADAPLPISGVWECQFSK